MPYDITITAKAIAASLAGTDALVGEAEARRLAFSFVENLDKQPSGEAVLELVRDEPPTVGDLRFDALLAAVVEHGCACRRVKAPGWVDGPGRFLESWWFVAGMRSLHADALVHSPISFARRGVFITSGALSYA